MKRLCWILALCLLCCAAALAASAEIPDPVYPAATDAQTNPETLYLALDGNAATCWRFPAWTSTATDTSPEASFWFGSERIGAVWLRIGDCAGEAAYWQSAAPTAVTVRVYSGYSYSDHSYTLSDVYDLWTVNSARSEGYACLALPSVRSNVTRVDLFVTGWRRGSAYANEVCLADVVFSRSTGAAAPGGQNQGIRTTLSMRLATRSGPSTKYSELGSYFQAGEPITVLTRAYDSGNGIWWVQVEFTYRGMQRRAYTGLKRVNLDVNLVPQEALLGEAVVQTQAVCYYGPGPAYTRYKDPIAAGTRAQVYNREGGYVQLEMPINSTQKQRVWVSEQDVTLSWQSDGGIIY